MSELCHWYQLTEQPSDGDFRVFQHDDGTIIKFKMSADDIPFIEIHTTKSKRNIKNSLESVGYDKDKDRYIKGSVYAIRYKTAQILGNHNKRVIFTIQDTTI